MKSGVQQAITVSITEPFQDAAYTDFPAIYVKASRNPDELTEEETARYGFFLSSYLKRLEHAHSQFVEGFLDEPTWKAIDAGARIQFQSIGMDRYWNVRKVTYSEKFRGYVAALIVEASPGEDTMTAVDAIRLFKTPRFRRVRQPWPQPVTQ